MTTLVFHINGKYLLSGSDDKSIRIWDLSNGRCPRKIFGAHDHFVTSLAIKGKLLVSGGTDNKIKVW